MSSIHEESNPQQDEQASSISMDEWFNQATAEECDNMSALQLEYLFKGDVFGKWWTVLLQVGVKHNVSAGTYSAPNRDDGRTFTANELLEFLDKFAIPRLYSTLQDLPTELDTSKEDERWGRSLRDEIIFLKFHKKLASTKVLGPKRKRKPAVQEAAPAPAVELRKSSRERDSVTLSEPGVQAFMQQKHKSTRNKLEAPGDEETYESVVFPTIKEYAAHTYPLDEVEKIEKAFEEDFAEWRFLLSTNHSLLFYGAGSKRTLLNKFADEELKKDGDILVVDGFDKDVTIEGILNLLVDYWLEGVHPKVKLYQVYQPVGQDGFPRVGVNFPRRGDCAVVQKAMAIARALACSATCTSKRRPLYLVLHNIDGVRLRNPTAQEALAGLVLNCSLDNGVNCLRLVASVDHVNGPALLWDSLVGASFRWMWKPIHTYRPYIEEITGSKIADGQTKSAKRKRAEENYYTEGSVFSVLLSLAPRHTEALQALATLQIGMIAKRGEEWVNYIDLMRQCQKNIVMSADNQLRIFLTELADQGMVERRDSSGSPMYRIPYSQDKLKEIVDYKRDIGTAPNETHS
jgi:origin recognition complex subunit 2